MSYSCDDNPLDAERIAEPGMELCADVNRQGGNLPGLRLRRPRLSPVPLLLNGQRNRPDGNAYRA